MEDSFFYRKNHLNEPQPFSVDVVFCIDATGSMSPVIDLVRNNARNFYGDVMRKMAEKGKKVDHFRIRVIAFRDYAFDEDAAMLTTGFFSLPEETAAFEEVLNGIQPQGGGDDPEDGLEALGYAIRSKWTQNPGKKRYLIVVWSDDATHDIGHSKNAKNYPQKMAKDFTELTTWWNGLDQMAKRLLIYAPLKEYWSTISGVWDNTVHFPSEAGKGLDKVTYDEICKAVAESIG